MAKTLQSVFDLPEVSFIENDTIDDMMQRMVSNFEQKHEEITGKSITLGRGDERRLILYTAAMELFHIEQHVDRAGKQDLLKYSYGEFLDNLAGNRGVVRQPASPAKTTLRFTLSQALGFVVSIPEGTRATNGEGLTFETTEYAEVPAGQTYIDVPAQCTENGIEGNDFLAGQIDDLVDTIGYVESVSNITTTAGGTDVESDASLAERTFLAPSSFSVAGPESAYIYWTRTFNPSIGSVKVVSPSACAVDVYILMQDGSIPGSDIISGLEQLLEGSGVRPLTDLVTVKAPTTSAFSVDLSYYINKSDSDEAVTIQERVQEAVDSYVKWQTTEIGRDINPSELVRLVQEAGAKRCVINAPAFTTVGDTAVATCSGKTVTYGGVEDD